MVKVLHFVSKMDRAGQETFLMNVMRNIDRSKVRFNFLCSSEGSGDYDEEIVRLGGGIFHLPAIRPCGNKFKRIRKAICVIRDWLLANKDKYDIVHLHTYHNLDVWAHLEACRQAGVRHVIIHSHNTNGPHVYAHKALGWICKHFYRFDKFACSKEAGEWLFGKRSVAKGEVSVIANGIDIEAYAYDKETAQRKKDELDIKGLTVIGHIGRFSAQKNHRFLLEVFAEYLNTDPNAVLMLIGRGELEAQIRQQASDMKISDKVMFMGVRSDVPELLSAMDVFVFPSLYEGLGIVLIEAQCAKLPVIASDNIPEEAVISSGIVLKKTENATDWADEIKKLVGIDRERIDLLDNASSFDIKAVARKLEEFYVGKIS